MTAPVRKHIGTGMVGLRSYLLHNRAVGALVFAAALLLRALVPAGYMVAPAHEAQQVFVTVCTGLEGKVQRIALPAGSHSDPVQKSHDSKDSPCAFTALAGLADMPVLADLAPLAARAETAVSDSFAVSIGRGLAAPPPPQTGPPAIA